jgi:hypothetical protein
MNAITILGNILSFIMAFGVGLVLVGVSGFVLFVILKGAITRSIPFSIKYLLIVLGTGIGGMGILYVCIKPILIARENAHLAKAVAAFDADYYNKQIRDRLCMNISDLAMAGFDFYKCTFSRRTDFRPQLQTKIDSIDAVYVSRLEKICGDSLFRTLAGSGQRRTDFFVRLTAFRESEEVRVGKFAYAYPLRESGYMLLGEENSRLVIKGLINYCPAKDTTLTSP